MSKFILHGTIVDNPIKETTKKGVDVVVLKVEEKYRSAYRENVSTYSIEFVGKNAECIPQGVRLYGAQVIVLGSLSSREWQGRFYTDLKGEGITIVSSTEFIGTKEPITQEEVKQSADENMSPTEQFDDDDETLPF